MANSSIIRSALALVLAGGVWCGAAADEADPTDLVFSTPHLAGLEAGAVLTYRHQREVAADSPIGPALDSVITLESPPEGGSDVIITMDADGAGRRLDPFRGVPGNPVLMVFLEGVTRAVSRATGGSPFYIRNRIRESFGNAKIENANGARGNAQDVVLQPFVEDRNRARLAAFADIELRLRIDPDAPGMLALLSASVPVADAQSGTPYTEEISLAPTR